MNTICIMCPIGCPLQVEKINGEIVVTGNTCRRGQAYGVAEFTLPKRGVTTLVSLKSGGVASVKTTAPVPKENVFDVVHAVKAIVAKDSVKIGDVVIKNVLNLGVNVVVTGKKSV
ncbi:MAG: DUF1667 domain-containing protein [Clostridia bacterium]